MYKIYHNPRCKKSREAIEFLKKNQNKTLIEACSQIKKEASDEDKDQVIKKKQSKIFKSFNCWLCNNFDNRASH